MNRRTALGLSAVAFALAACNALPGGGGRPSATPAVPAASNGAPSLSPAPTATDTPQTPKPSAVAGLDDREFVSAVVDDPNHKLVNGTRILIRFYDGKIGASAGCNSIGGDYELDDGKLVVGALAQTEIGCEAKLQKQDEWLIKLLNAKPELSLNGNDLVLTSDPTTVTFVDRAVAEPNQPLAMRTWGLTTILTGDVASSVPSGVTATLLFKDNGELQLFDGCNSGGGQYTVDGDRITFSNLVSTDMACGGAQGTVVQAVVAVLRAESVTFSIERATLTLQAGGRGLQYAAAVNVTN